MAYTTIDDPSAHFHTQLFTGDDNADRLITNDANAGDFRPDLLWLKNRSSVSSQCIFDSSRLASSESTVMLRANGTGAEEDKVDRFGGFETDGFTVDGNDVDTNADGDLFVAWQWKANGGTRTTNTESGNDPAGGYQANTTAGFSIVDYTGTGATGTMAHGLGAVPHLMIIKNREIVGSWLVYHHKNTSAPETDILELQANNATYDNVAYWNDTAPTSSVFTINTSNDANKDADGIIAYLWTEIQGYSKFGGYTGNGNADGPFVYTGFKPRFVLVKCSNLVESWYIWDTTRSTFNLADDILNPNVSNAESVNADRAIDSLSNGFKLRGTNTATNGDGDTYIYAAFAHQPFVTSGGVPCTAH